MVPFTMQQLYLLAVALSLLAPAAMALMTPSGTNPMLSYPPLASTFTDMNHKYLAERPSAATTWMKAKVAWGNDKMRARDRQGTAIGIWVPQYLKTDLQLTQPCFASGEKIGAYFCGCWIVEDKVGCKIEANVTVVDPQPPSEVPPAIGLLFGAQSPKEKARMVDSFLQLENSEPAGNDEQRQGWRVEVIDPDDDTDR
ncbi:MAG: hypothetical protein M1833_003787 [Piccolia ochrophora]|nr:MAG: hypothetical protein M1833_003787 [Piccolia ochrophora]